MFLRTWKEQPVYIQGSLFLNLISKCRKKRKLLRLPQLIVLATHFYIYIYIYIYISKKVLVKVQIKKKLENIYIYFGQKNILFSFIYLLLMLIKMFVTISTKIATKWYITCLCLKKLIFYHLAHAPLWKRAWNRVSLHGKHRAFLWGV